MSLAHSCSGPRVRLLAGASKPALAILLAVLLPTTAVADITNTVTATGSSPGGTDDVTATDSAAVTPALAVPGMTVNKVASFTDTGSPGAESGDVITYTYDVTNTGNTYLTNVSLNDVHGGAGSFTQPVLAAIPLTDNNLITASTDNGTDAVYDLLAPGDVVHFTATYTIDAGDILNNGGGDGTLDNQVTASASYENGTTSVPQSATDTESVPLYINSSLTVVKSASPSSGVQAGDVVNYTYVVTNNGNTSITAIALADNHNGSDPDPVPGNETLTNDAGTAGDSTDATANDGIWSVLAPGDEITLTATYTVTQSDVDLLQ